VARRGPEESAWLSSLFPCKMKKKNRQEHEKERAIQRKIQMAFVKGGAGPHHMETFARGDKVFPPRWCERTKRALVDAGEGGDLRWRVQPMEGK